MAIPSKLLEHVAGRIMSSLKDNFPQLQEVRLKLSKLNPPFSGEVHSASSYLTNGSAKYSTILFIFVP